MLEALGLDSSIEQLYRLMLSQPGWRIAEISAHLQWSEERVRAGLDVLADFRLVRPDVADPARIRPVSPQAGLTALLARGEAELNRRQRQIETIRTAVASLATEYGTGLGRSADVVDRIEGVDAVRRRLAELAETAQTECLSFLPGGAQAPDTMSASKPLDQQALERGVALRSIYQDSFRNDPATVGYVRWLAELGGESRTVPSLPMLMVVVDRRHALLPLDPDDGRRGAVELSTPGPVAAMCVLFEQFWAVATPWADPVPRRDGGLTPVEQELLRQLAAGNTDDVVARKLGVSVRTVRRMASDLMTRLDARSRFQAGVRAARLGWL